jgi:hypothetical protein
VASEPRSDITILFSFERGLDLRGDRLSEKQWQASDVWLAFRHSLCDKSVIGEPPNLTHNLALKRAAIGQLTGVIGSYPGGHSFGAATRPRPLRKMSGLCAVPVFEFWTSSFNSLLGLKNAILLAGTLTAAPVLGLRPVRALLSRVLKLPNPRSSTLSPLRKARTILSKISSTMMAASFAGISTTPETSSIRSALSRTALLALVVSTDPTTMTLPFIP